VLRLPCKVVGRGVSESGLEMDLDPHVTLAYVPVARSTQARWISVKMAPRSRVIAHDG
jgi:hypothetical protein